MLPIYDVTPFTMLDYPDKTACIIWFSGCNIRCKYCHNPDIVNGKATHSIEQVMAFLKKRQGLLDGVVLSGGEATIYKDIIGFAERVKKLGYSIKLDTNGTRPKIVKELIDKGLIDYIALDYKAPKAKYKSVTVTNLFNQSQETLAIVCKQNKIAFEIRTTVHSDLLDENDIKYIIDDLSVHNYKGIFYIQNYINNNDAKILGNLEQQIKPIDIGAIAQPENFKLEFRNF